MEYSTKLSFETKEITKKLFCIKEPNTWETLKFYNIYDAMDIVNKYPECKELQEWYIKEIKIRKPTYQAYNIYKINNNTTLSISTDCLESYPCQHQYYINDKRVHWDVYKCIDYFKNNGKNPPEHFKQYIGGNSIFDIELNFRE